MEDISYKWCEENGFKGVVEKPYEIYELNETLQKVIMEKS
jgi:hypothetical protein